MKFKYQLVSVMLLSLSPLATAQPDNVEQFVKEKRSILAIGKGNQKFDLFGLPQVLPKPDEHGHDSSSGQQAVVKPKVDIEAAVNKITLTFVDPKRDRIGVRGKGILKPGDKLSLKFEGEDIELSFGGARSNGAYFLNHADGRYYLQKNKPKQSLGTDEPSPTFDDISNGGRIDLDEEN